MFEVQRRACALLSLGWEAERRVLMLLVGIVEEEWLGVQPGFVVMVVVVDLRHLVAMVYGLLVEPQPSQKHPLLELVAAG